MGEGRVWIDSGVPRSMRGYILLSWLHVHLIWAPSSGKRFKVGYDYAVLVLVSFLPCTPITVEATCFVRTFKTIKIYHHHQDSLAHVLITATHRGFDGQVLLTLVGKVRT